MTSDQVKAGLMLAAAGVVGFIAWRAYRTGAGVAEAAGRFAADVQDFGSNLAAEGGRIASEAAEGVGRYVPLYRTAGDVKTVYEAVSSPANPVYAGVNRVGDVLMPQGAVPGRLGDGSWSLGAWLYDVTHEDPLASWKAPASVDPHGDFVRMDRRRTDPAAVLSTAFANPKPEGSW